MKFWIIKKQIVKWLKKNITHIHTQRNIVWLFKINQAIPLRVLLLLWLIKKPNGLFNYVHHLINKRCNSFIYIHRFWTMNLVAMYVYLMADILYKTKKINMAAHDRNEWKMNYRQHFSSWAFMRLYCCCCFII